jgi:hypothetical protein
MKLGIVIKSILLQRRSGVRAERPDVWLMIDYRPSYRYFTGALSRFAEALERLLRDGEARARLGREGRAWVNETHNPERFLEAFRSLCARTGLRPLPPSLPAGEQGRGL